MAEPSWGRLVVVERPDAFVVAREADPADWLARFARAPGFPAREWAEGMVRTYNRRLSGPGWTPPFPAGVRPSRYEPLDED